MTTKPWKFDIGNFVMPVVMNNPHATKMVITGRIEAEYEDHTERCYVCSHHKLGEYGRQQLMESEIVFWTD